MIDYTNSQMAFAIDEYIHSKRDRAILKDRLIDHMTYSEIAEAHNLSDSQVTRIVYKGQRIVFSKLKAIDKYK
jgi:DNA-directed RNA polymerase specialized sigma subunit